MTQVYVSDLRKLGYCAKGAREFCQRHDIDWMEFVRNGLPAEIIEATGDAMAIKLVEAARGKQ